MWPRHLFLMFLRDQEFRPHHIVFPTFFSTFIFRKNGECQYITTTHELQWRISIFYLSLQML